MLPSIDSSNAFALVLEPFGHAQRLDLHASNGMASKVARVLDATYEQYTDRRLDAATTAFSWTDPSMEVMEALAALGARGVRVGAAEIELLLSVHGVSDALNLERQLLSRLHVSWAPGAKFFHTTFGLSMTIPSPRADRKKPNSLAVDLRECGDYYELALTLQGDREWLRATHGSDHIASFRYSQFDRIWSSGVELLQVPRVHARRFDHDVASGRHFVLHNYLLEERNASFEDWPKQSLLAWARSLPRTHQDDDED